MGRTGPVDQFPLFLTLSASNFDITIFTISLTIIGVKSPVTGPVWHRGFQEV
jgi:hypothetical protein